MTTPTIFNRKSAVEGVLNIYGIIGDFGVSAQAVSDALAEAAGVKVLRVFVDSPGGDLFAGKAIYNQLARFAKSAEVLVTVDGLAASAASFLIQAATRITMAPQATMMVHEAHAVGGGRAEDLRKLADLLEAENEALVAIYAKRTGKDPKAIAEMLSAETWMNAREAVENGFADEVLDDAPRAAAAVTITAQDRVRDAARELRLAAAQAEALRIRRLSNAASRGAAPGKPGPTPEQHKEKTP